jgi:hypothetical protein
MKISEDSNATAERKIGGILSEDQCRVLIQFQEACRVIGAHDSCTAWTVLACAIEAELTALDLGVSRVLPNEAATASRAYHRAELEKYLARPDAGRGDVKIEEALRTLLAAGAPNQAGQEEAWTWIAVLYNTVDSPGPPWSPSSAVTWHRARGMSSIASPKVILMLCGSIISRYQISRVARRMPEPTNQDRLCANCALASNLAQNERSVRIDLKALVDACLAVIVERPHDGSPPMVALNADIVHSVAIFARTLSREFGGAKSPGEALRWQEFAASGPHVGGDAAADAWGSVVHPIHVSAVRLHTQVTRRAAEPAEPVARPFCNDAGHTELIVHPPLITQVLREALDKWQGLAEGMRSPKFQPPSDQKLQRDLERIELLRQLLNAEERVS